MRIIAGKHRGRQIVAPEGMEIRPTSDRVREGVFNILEHRDLGIGGKSALVGTRVLDAFCGTGAFGLEALSRGAEHSTFLDISNTALDLCRQNIVALNEGVRTDLLRTDCLKSIYPAEPCGLVFMDPPYSKNLAQPALLNLGYRGWIADKAVCIVESGPDEILNMGYAFILLEDRKYGRTRIRIFLYNENN
ncbi:MAG: Ribosomal RNA small subunit methyltransferase D [Alphaproteobacteria bacterium MarineAlpha11_Bin1]|nr:MAG: Ribosomal RNA small subunit methyltransferase D [Alphaproteobacteria bacterium MarineAlpha11_Bin1]